MEDRSNRELNDAIEQQINMWYGTIHGQEIKNAYENGCSYEQVCEMAGIDIEDYE